MSERDDITVKSTKRAACPHGADMSLEIETTRTDIGFTVRAKQLVCPLCIEEMGETLKYRMSRAIFADFSTK